MNHKVFEIVRRQLELQPAACRARLNAEVDRISQEVDDSILWMKKVAGFSKLASERGSSVVASAFEQWMGLYTSSKFGERVDKILFQARDKNQSLIDLTDTIFNLVLQQVHDVVDAALLSRNQPDLTNGF